LYISFIKLAIFLSSNRVLNLIFIAFPKNISTCLINRTLTLYRIRSGAEDFAQRIRYAKFAKIPLKSQIIILANLGERRQE